MFQTMPVDLHPSATPGVTPNPRFFVTLFPYKLDPWNIMEVYVTKPKVARLEKKADISA